MEPDKNKDIAERVAEMLREHSLPYEEGAWERFKKYEAMKSRKLVLWPYLSAAATILLAVTLFINKDDDQVENDKQLAKTEVASGVSELEDVRKNDPADVPAERHVSSSEKTGELAEIGPLLAVNENKKISRNIEDSRSPHSTSTISAFTSVKESIVSNQGIATSDNESKDVQP